MAVAAIAKIGAKIAAKSAGAMKGVAKSTKTFAKSAAKNAKIKKRVRVAGKKFMKKRREKKRRREQEEALEQQKNQRKSERKKTGGAGGGILQRLISFIQAILLGFIFNKLPQIIDFLKKIIETIKNIVKKFKNFFDSIVGFFKDIGKVISKAFDVIKNISFGKIKDKIMGAFGQIKENFLNIASKLGDSVKNFLGFKKKPKKELKTEIDKGDTTDENQRTSVADINSTMAKKNDEWNNTIRTIEKAGTGVDIVGRENLDKTIDPDSEEGQAQIKKQNKEMDKAFGGKPSGATDAGGTVAGTGAESDTVNTLNTGGNTESTSGSGNNSDMNESQEINEERDVLKKGVDNLLKKEVKSTKKDSTIINTEQGSSNLIKSNINQVNTSKLTPERKPKHTIMMVNNKESQLDGTGDGKKQTNIIVIEKGNTVDDQLNLALSE